MKLLIFQKKKINKKTNFDSRRIFDNMREGWRKVEIENDGLHVKQYIFYIDI